MGPSRTALAISALTTLLLTSACSKPTPPRVTPLSIRATSIDPSALGLTLELDVYNPNGFSLLVQTVDGVLELASGAPIGQAHSQPQGSIPAKASKLMTAELRATWTNLVALAPYALSAQPVPFQVRGKASIGSERLNVDVPFTIKGELTPAQVLAAGLRGLPPLQAPGAH
ncbi:MAG TPA: LEA type 2 family protein [Polyangiaceae bacterium]|nr:LEA type 2 family protein [Polyangiaceae bacterium]